MGPPGSNGGLFSGLVLVASLGLPTVFIISIIIGFILKFFISLNKIYKFNIATSVSILLLLVIGSVLNSRENEPLEYFKLGLVLGIAWTIITATGVSLGIIINFLLHYLWRKLSKLL